MTLPPSQFHQVEFNGGLDTETPPWETKPGTLLDALNWEVGVSGGYSTINGYERYDGQPRPSAAQYARLDVTITGTIEVDDTVTGADSSATGYVLAVVTTGAQPYIVITKITGTFNSSEDLEVSAVVEANTDLEIVIDGAPTAKLHGTYKNLAADLYRADILKVPGAGSILGVKRLGATVYAWRNAVGEATAEMYKSSAAGWVKVELGFELSYTSGGILAARATGTVTLDSGASGSVDGITVDSIEVMSGAVSFDTDLETTATAVALNITAYTSVPNYSASADGDVITITALPLTSGPNGFVVVSSITTITTTDVNLAGGVDQLVIVEGDVIEGASSGALATVTRMIVEEGTQEAGTAEGRFIFLSQTGTFQAEEIDIQGGTTGVATIAGDSDAIIQAPGGSFEQVNGIFGGTKRIYGADTSNRGFEFDGTTFAPIDTGMVDDTPDHVVVHNSHLFFSFDASLQHSGINDPFPWTPLTGASEIATRDLITGFMGEPGEVGTATLGVYNRNITHMLYGTSSADWELKTYREELGALPYTIQQFGNTTFLDDRGITDMETAQEFGNFNHAMISKDIQTWLNLRKSQASASCIARDKNQYRLFFSNGEGLYITRYGVNIVGIMPVGFPLPVLTITSEENPAGDEEIYFGSDDGYVYQLDKGTSFDGEVIDTLLQLHFDFINTVGYLKKFQALRLDVTGYGYTEYSFNYELSNGDVNEPQPDATTTILEFSEIRWDVGTWDVGNWDVATIQPVHEDLDGEGENVSIIIRTNSDEFLPLRMAGAFIRYLKRRAIR